MSEIAINEFVNLQDSQGTITRIGVSDAISNHTIDEILKFVYCGATSNKHKGMIMSATETFLSSNTKSPISVVSYNRNNSYITVNDGSRDYDNTAPYVKTIWLYGSGIKSKQYITKSDTSVKVVTNMDVNKIFIKISQVAAYWGNDWTNRQTNTWNINGKAADTLYDIEASRINASEDPTTISSRTDIAPFAIIPVGDTYAIINLLNRIVDNGGAVYNNDVVASTWHNLYKTFDNNNGFGFSPNCHAETSMWQFYWAGGRGTVTIYGKSINDAYSCKLDLINNSTQNLIYVPNQYEEVMKMYACCGVYFKADKMFKPIISGGVVTGYSEDLETKSEIDDYTFNKGNSHDVPDTPTPPEPTPGDEDETDDMDIGTGLSSGGIARYYSLTSEQMSQLLTKMSSDDVPEGYDPFISVIDVKQYPFNNRTLLQLPTPGTVVFRGWDTEVPCVPITAQRTKWNLGTIEVPRKNDNFLDYAPYSQYEIFIPFCGWVTLSDKVVGKTLTVDLIFDLCNATCNGVVRMTISENNTVIASKSGKIARDFLVTGDAVGIKSAATSMSLVNVATGLTSTGVGAITGSLPAFNLGILSTIGGIVQGNIANNNNYTRSVGSLGDLSDFGMMKTAYLKISYPQSKEPSNYGKSVGYIVNKWGRLGDYSGFTIMDNPHISIDAYDVEKEELKNLLEHGVIM